MTAVAKLAGWKYGWVGVPLPWGEPVGYAVSCKYCRMERDLCKTADF